MVNRGHAAGRIAAIAAGVLPALAFPEPGAWWLAWFGLVPMVLLVTSAPASREASMRAWIGGAAYALAVHHWLLPKTGPFALVPAAVLGAAWIPWALGARRGLPGVPLAAAAWVLAEVARSWEPLGGPWALYGTSQWNHPTALRLAATTGVWGLSFILVATNVAIAHALRSRSGRASALAVALVAVGHLPGLFARDQAPERVVRVAGVQPGVVETRAARLAAGERATVGLGPRAPDLVVWGESSVGAFPIDRPDVAARLAAAARAAGADVLVNVDARRGPGGIFKSAVLVGPDGARGTYDKMRLVPFGEWVPLRRVLGWLPRLTDAPAEDRRRGRGPALLRTAGLEIGPLVCFESAFPDMTRALARMGADVVVVQSSTSTFQDSWAPEQHAALAAVRAVESGRPVVHATLTGVSAAFDANGRRLAWVPTSKRGPWFARVPLATGTTPFVRYGDWVPGLSALLIAGWALVRVHPRRARR